MDSRLVERYFEKSGDDKLPEGNREENENGFCIWSILDTRLVLKAVYGNGKYWNEWATNKANELELKTVLFATKRSPEGFMRKFNFKIIGYMLERSV